LLLQGAKETDIDMNIMEEKVIATLTAPEGQRRRVKVYRRIDGLYSFFEEYEYKHLLNYDKGEDSDFEWRWAKLPPHQAICESPTAAEREAYGRIGWLARAPTTPGDTN
jgi:hypothetical protein